MTVDLTIPIQPDEISGFYKQIIEAEVALKDDPLEDGEYASQLYINESICHCALLIEEMSRLQLRVNITTSSVERRLSSWELSGRVMRSPEEYSPDQVKKVSAGVSNATVVREKIALEKLHLRELKLLAETLKEKVKTLRRTNSDIRLQEKVVANQLFLKDLGRGPKDRR